MTDHPRSGPPLILHVVYSFYTGGLENGVVNLINRLDGYRHAVLAIDGVDPAFCARVRRPDVDFISLRKPPGQTLKVAPAFVRELRRLRPAVVHTRNLAALELQLPAAWSGIGARVHGEHGRDIDDPLGLSRRHQWMRRIYRPFVQQWVALSTDLQDYLTQRCGVPARKVQRICNGVDHHRFEAVTARQPIEGSPFNDPSLFVVGTVGRMQAVKAQDVLVDAFIDALRRDPAQRERLRLVLVGGGALRTVCEERLQAAGVRELAWLPGERADVPALMRSFDAFVLPSHAEGISNTILEAMASALPVLATRVGGNPELVDDGVSGRLVPAGDAGALAEVLLQWVRNPSQSRALGQAGRHRVEGMFSLDGMVNAYDALYARLIAGRPS